MSNTQGLPASAGCRCLQFKLNSGLALETRNNFKEVAGVGIAGRPEHPHQAFGRVAGNLCQFIEADGGVDIVAQHPLAGFYVSGQEALDPPREATPYGKQDPVAPSRELSP